MCHLHYRNLKFSVFYSMAEARERTFIMIKPDGVHRGLVGKIIKRFEAKGFKLVAMKFMWVSSIPSSMCRQVKTKCRTHETRFVTRTNFFLTLCES